MPPGVLSCRWPASSPHAFVTCLLSQQAAAYNSRCSTRWLSSPDRTLPRRPPLPARRRRPRFVLRRFFRLFRQLHRDFFFLPAGEALGVSGVRHSGGPALGCLLHAIVRTAKCVREMRFYTSTCSFKNTVKKHPFPSCLRIGPSYPTPPWLPARPAGRSCPRCSRGLRPPSLHAAQTLPVREPFREPCWARRRPPCDRPHSRGFTRRSRPGRVRSAEPRPPPGPEPCRSLTPGFATPGPARPFVPARPWVSHQQIQSPLMGNSIFAFPEAVSKPRGKCRLASALNLRIGRAACRWVFEDPKVLCGFSTARGSAPLTPACSRFTCVCVNNFSPRLAS